MQLYSLRKVIRKYYMLQGELETGRYKLNLDIQLSVVAENRLHVGQNEQAESDHVLLSFGMRIGSREGLGLFYVGTCSDMRYELCPLLDKWFLACLQIYERR